MRTFAVMALGASALFATACVPPGPGPGYRGNDGVAAYSGYDDGHRLHGASWAGGDHHRAGPDGRDGDGPPPPWMMQGHGNDPRHGDGRDHDGPPPGSMAGGGGDHHDGPPPWAGNGGPQGGHVSGPPDQRGYCGPVFFPGCVPRR